MGAADEVGNGSEQNACGAVLRIVGLRYAVSIRDNREGDLQTAEDHGADNCTPRDPSSAVI